MDVLVFDYYRVNRVVNVNRELPDNGVIEHPGNYVHDLFNTRQDNCTDNDTFTHLP